MSKIYTKTGDQGTSGLFGGQRVPKNHPRLEAYGTIDELNSAIGLIQISVPELQQIQSDLFLVGTELATPQGKPQLAATRIADLERSIDAMTAELPELKHFILPGGHSTAATTHLARTICRRAERRIIQLAETEPVNPVIIQYMNRLSDWLFTLARYLNKQHGVTDHPWP